MNPTSLQKDEAVEFKNAVVDVADAELTGWFDCVLPDTFTVQGKTLLPVIDGRFEPVPNDTHRRAAPTRIFFCEAAIIYFTYLSPKRVMGLALPHLKDNTIISRVKEIFH